MHILSRDIRFWWRMEPFLLQKVHPLCLIDVLSCSTDYMAQTRKGSMPPESAQVGKFHQDESTGMSGGRGLAYGRYEVTAAGHSWQRCQCEWCHPPAPHVLCRPIKFSVMHDAGIWDGEQWCSFAMWAGARYAQLALWCTPNPGVSRHTLNSTIIQEAASKDAHMVHSKHQLYRSHDCLFGMCRL